MKKLIFFLLALLVLLTKFFAQVPPTVDNTWILQTGLSDEFNATEINEDQWCILGDHNDCEYYNWGGHSAFSQDHSYINNGILILQADPPIGSFCCFTGGIQSLDYSYSYGYFEIYAKLPGYIDQYGDAHTRKIWPAFWLYNTDYATFHDEIDIFDGYHTFDGLSIVQQAVDEDQQSYYNPADVFYQIFSYNATPYCASFHKYAAEWNHDRLIFYFDDQVVGYIYNHPGLEMQPLKLIMDFQLFSQENYDYLMQYFWEIDYVRYYKLNQACSTDKLLLTPIAYGHYLNHPAVYRNITIGNGSTSFSISAGTSKTFRASNEITINGEFTVPLNAELNIIPTPCE